VLEGLESMVRPGITTKEIDAAAAEMIAERGCKSAFLGYRGFPGTVCVSVNDEVVHGIGGPRRLQFGDIVKIDTGVIRKGWVGDTATTVPVGAIDPDWERLLRVTQETLGLAIPYATAGRRLGDLCAAIERNIREHGYSVVREFVGHGVGRSLHEEPQVPNYGRPGTGPKLKAGMVLAIEPMVNMGRPGVKILQDGWTVVTSDGSPSAHFEHTVLVTRDEPEILTWRGKTVSR
jgi:methionyl aminopeptidase